MNYLQQILAFNSRQFNQPLSNGQFVLWHALMSINNECAWIEWFTVTNIRLESFTSLSRQGIDKARNKLKQRGFIDFKSNGHRKATSYKIIKLYDDKETKEIPETSSSLHNSSHSSLHSSLHSGLHNSRPLNKQNKTKQNETNNMLLQVSKTQNKLEPSDNDNALQQLYEFYQHNFGIPSDVITESLGSWLEDMPVEVILEAMTLAVKQHKTFRYAEGILRSWKRKNIKTIDDVNAEQVAYENEMQRRQGFKKKQVVRMSQAEHDAMNDVDTPLSEEERAKLLDGL